MPTLSVIIPVYNRERYLPEALESVLNQTRPADEIIVVNDGSTDRSEEVARSHGKQVRVISQANAGCGPARNTGINLAAGDLIAFLDSDDIWSETKLERQCALLSDRPELDLISCRMVPFLSPEINDAELPKLNENVRIACNASGLLARRRALEVAGPFRGDLRVGEFVEWLGRALEKGLRHDTVPEVLLRRRSHHGNMVRDAEAKVDYLRLLKQRLDRRRSAAA